MITDYFLPYDRLLEIDNLYTFASRVYMNFIVFLDHMQHFIFSVCRLDTLVLNPSIKYCHVA